MATGDYLNDTRMRKLRAGFS